MNKNKLLVIDIETTGFSPKNASIVEIGIVELDLTNGETKVLLDSLCREERFDHTHKEDKMGWIFDNSTLTFEDILCAPLFDEVARKAQEIIEQYPVGMTAFSRNFDVSFLEDRGIVFGKFQPCPMRVATPVCGLKKKNGQGGKAPSVQEAWNHLFPDTEYVELHRGADDAVHEAKIVYALFKMGVYFLDLS